MKWYFITFRSITPAQRGEKLLRQGGVEAMLMRSPRQMAANGCGYSLRIRTVDAELALSLIRAHELAYGKVFTQEGKEVEV